MYHSDIIANFEGTYIHKNKCFTGSGNEVSSKANSYKVIGLGAAVALLSTLLLLVTGVLIWTCWIMRKTTEFRYTK